MVEVFNDSGKLLVLIDFKNLNECINYIKSQKVYGIYFQNINDDKLLDFNFLKELNFVSLAINNSKFDLTKVPFLEKVESLYLNDFKGKVDFSKFPNLNFCSLDWNAKIQIENSPKRPFQLIIRNYNPKSKSLKELFNLESLEHLELQQTRIESLSGIDSFQQLTHLQIHYAPKLFSICELLGIKNNISTLIIENSKNIQDYKCIAELKKISTLSLSETGNIQSIKFIKNMPNLKDFRFVGTTIIDGNLSFCEKLDFSGFENKKHYSHTFEDLNPSW